MAVYGGPGQMPGAPAPQQQFYAPPPPSVRFDAIGEAWSVVKGQLGNWVLATLVFFGISFAVSFLLQALLGAVGMGQSSGTGGSGSTGAVLVSVILSNVVSLLLTAYFQAGIWRMALNNLRTGNASLNDLFSGGDVLGKMIVTYLLMYAAFLVLGLVIGVAGGATVALGSPLFLLGLIPAAVVISVVLSLRLYFATGLVADRRMPAMEALKASWNAMGGHTLSFFLFLLVLGLIAFAGTLLTCGIGLLVLYPLANVAYAIVYRDFFPDMPVAQGPTLDMPLPPPSAYQPGQYPPPPPPSTPYNPQG